MSIKRHAVPVYECNQETNHRLAISRVFLTLASLLFLLCADVQVSTAQSYLTATGSPTFSAPEPVEYGFTETANGNLHLEFPLGSFPERGSKEPYRLRLLYDSHIWGTVYNGSGQVWSPILGGWGYATATSGLLSEADYVWLGCGADFSWTDRFATTHVFALPNIETVNSNPGCATTGDAFATDSSGFHLYFSNFTITIYAPDGTLIYGNRHNNDPQGNSILVEDANGNYFSENAANQVLDTLQRKPAVSYDIANSQADTSRSHYAVTNATIAVHTAFGQSGIAEGSYNITVIQSITLPDNTTFSFKYDCDSTLNSLACSSPHGQSAYYGVMTSMATATGGTVTYNYTTFADSYGNRTRWLTTRSGSGYSTYTPQVISTCSSTSVGCQQKLTVRKPTGDMTVYTFTLDNGAWPTLIQDYDAQNNLMSTTTNAWDFTTACVLHGCHGHNFIRLLSQTVAVPMPGGTQLTKKTAYAYDSPQKGNVTSIKEWKYLPGSTPAFPAVADRATYMAYYSAGTNIINKPLSVTVCNNSGSDVTNCPGGGSRLSQTLYTYDSYSSCPSGLKPVLNVSNHDDTNFGSGNTQRGNVTQIQNWVSGSAFLSTKQCFDTTGQIYQSSDPAGNLTTYDYTDNFFIETGAASMSAYAPAAATNAYPKTITMGGLATTFGYYFGSGKRAFSTDPNNVTTSLYFWNSLDRQTQTNFPIGWNLTNYTSATQGDVYVAVGDTSASSGCASCVHKQFNFDTWGRKANEKLVNAPGGAVNLDTYYDGNSRVSWKSHAYRTTSDPSYVFEKFSYDALDRKISVNHPDNQWSYQAYGSNVANLAGVTTQQSAATTYGYGYPSISLDEAGKQRQQWVDGFGRTIEVDEPSSNNGAPGSKSITVSGSEQSVTRDPCQPIGAGSCPYTTYDSGTVTVTVNGYRASANFAQGSTLSSVTSDLVAALNVGASPVTATLSGSTITMTAKGAGASTNYSFTTSYTFDTNDFTFPSFSASPASGSLTGGSGGISSAPLITTYTYDASGNLTQVVQGLQARTFAYDGLGRIISRTTPEGGTDTFYFTRADGVTLCAGSTSAVCRKTDARGITTTYTYDSLSRMTGRTYSNGQGAVTYQYDQGGAAVFALGRLTTLTDPSGSETYSYNQMGWITQTQKTISAVPFTTKYQYNAAGQVIQVTYPSNRVVQLNVDNIGLLNTIVSGGTSYVSIPEPPTGYDAAGHLLQFNYANGVVANFGYSATRNQITSLSYVKGTTTLFGLNYGYNRGQANCDTTTTTGNDGLIQCVQDTVDSGRSTIHTYDSLSRLATTVTAGSAGYAKWGLSWTYDRYGNRANQNLTVGGGPTNLLTFATTPPPPANPPGGAYTNRPDGYSFDASGNMLNDGANNLAYDADNCMTSVGTTTYTCDAHGTRVKKALSGSTNTAYVFSSGQDIAEYDFASGSSPSAGSPSREYIYLAGRLIATIQPASTIYHHSDHLSVRMTTDSTGAKIGEQGHYPYGEIWYATNTTTKFIFTSYSRDAESGNDYAMARFYINRFGRFSCADPVLGSPADPQSWNRYAYVRNNPVNITDPTGQWWLPKLFGGVLAVLGVLTGDPALTQAGLQLAGASLGASSFDRILGPGTPPTFPGGPAGLPPAPLGGYKSLYNTPPFLDPAVAPTWDSIADFKADFYANYGKQFNHCIWSVFGADAKRIAYQTLANAPFVNTKFSDLQLGGPGMAGGNPGDGAAAWNQPDKGPHGTVYIAKGGFYSNGPNAENANYGSYAHELANILDGKLNPQGTTGGQPYEGTYGQANDPWDADTGAQVEECMFGGFLQGTNGPYPYPD
jgi:RHS repeat-associated protein